MMVGLIRPFVLPQPKKVRSVSKTPGVIGRASVVAKYCGSSALRSLSLS